MMQSVLNWVKVLRPTRHKIGHFADVHQANLLAWCGKTKPNTTKACIHQSNEMYYNTKKLKLGLVASYDIWPGKWEGLFVFQRFINLSLTYLLTYLLRHLPTYLQPWDPQRALDSAQCSISVTVCSIVKCAVWSLCESFFQVNSYD